MKILLINNFHYRRGGSEAVYFNMADMLEQAGHEVIFFSCTDEEKTVLRNKLKYDGMTIMAVGQLQQYATAGGYLKGKMIRLLDINDDSHIAQAIYEEVAKGFYEGE